MKSFHNENREKGILCEHLIGVPYKRTLYAYQRAYSMCENHEKRERRAYLMSKKGKNTAHRIPIQFQSPVQEPSINVKTVDNDHFKADTSSKETEFCIS